MSGALLGTIGTNWRCPNRARSQNQDWRYTGTRIRGKHETKLNLTRARIYGTEYTEQNPSCILVQNCELELDQQENLSNQDHTIRNQAKTGNKNLKSRINTSKLIANRRFAHRTWIVQSNWHSDYNNNIILEQSSIQQHQKPTITAIIVYFVPQPTIIHSISRPQFLFD